MLIRAARLMLIVALGLSACTLSNLNRSGEDIAPSPLPSIDVATEISPVQTLPAEPPVIPSESNTATEAPQFQSAPTATNQPVESVVASANTGPAYKVQAGTPRSMANFILPDSGCNWMGVGGQAFNLSGQPVTKLVVEVGGTLAGADVFHLELTGNQTNLGAGGYLITLSNRPIASNASLWILLYDLAGQPLTTKTYFSTVQDCSQNFILINFVEVDPNFLPRAYFPYMSK